MRSRGAVRKSDGIYHAGRFNSGLEGGSYSPGDLRENSSNVQNCNKGLGNIRNTYKKT